MNYQDSREVTYRLLDMVCDTSIQNETKQMTDAIIESFFGESDNINYKETVVKLVDMVADLSIQKDSGDAISALVETISNLSSDDIKLIIDSMLGVLRDAPTYEGLREMLYQVSNMLCDGSIYNETGEIVEILLEKAGDLPDYDVLLDNVKLIIDEAQYIMRDLPTYEGALEIAYELMNLGRDLPIYDTIMNVVNMLLQGNGNMAGLLKTILPAGQEASEENNNSYKMVSNF